MKVCAEINFALLVHLVLDLQAAAINWKHSQKIHTKVVVLVSENTWLSNTKKHFLKCNFIFQMVKFL